MKTFKVDRRIFLKVTGGISIGLLIGFKIQGCSKPTGMAESKSGVFQPNAWVNISPDNIVTVTVAQSEMGQGIMTSLPMLVAEELEVEWTKIRVERAPNSPEYGYQVTEGSNSIRNGWKHYRQVGAIAREMLISAAANKWGVQRSECRAKSHTIVHTTSGKQLSYGELAIVAAKLPIPAKASLKDSKNFKIIGKSTLSLDIPIKVNGEAVFGCDIKLDNLLIATITHCPVFGGKLISIDDSETKKITGVRHVIRIQNSVAVIADNFWAANKGNQLLKLKWDNAGNKLVNTASISQQLKAASEDIGKEISKTGDLKNARREANKIVKAVYEAPFEAHATMEPMNCTAYVRDGECDVWVPTQSPSSAESIASKYVFSKTQLILHKLKAKLIGTGLGKIRIHTTFLGGGFGRRLEQDYVAEAVQISKVIGKPIKLIWTREEDIQHDFYRPATYHTLEGGLDKSGKPIMWHHRVVGPAKGKPYGGAKELPYSIPNFLLEFVDSRYSVPTGLWRSVGSSHNGFVMESFTDELAHADGKDPVEFRSQLLFDSPRHKAVLEQAAQKANWGKDLPSNHYQGIALHKSNDSYVAQVAEISISGNRRIQVHRVVCVIDCGIVVNPDTVRAQMEGGIVFGLTACIKSAITIKGGRVTQSNFHDFPLLKLDEMPLIETHIIDSDAPPGGVGEPGVPPIAAAVANAVFAATGIRIRKLPILPKDLSSDH